MSDKLKPEFEGEWWLCKRRSEELLPFYFYGGEFQASASDDSIYDAVEPIERLYSEYQSKQCKEETPPQSESKNYDGGINVVKPTYQGDSVVSEVQEVEGFKNGDTVIHRGCEFMFVSILSEELFGTAVIYDADIEELRQVAVESLSKPETPEQAREREVKDLTDLICSHSAMHEEDLLSRKLYARGVRVVNGGLVVVDYE